MMLIENADLFATWGSHRPKGVQHASRKRKASLDVREDGPNSLDEDIEQVPMSMHIVISDKMG